MQHRAIHIFIQLSSSLTHSELVMVQVQGLGIHGRQSIWSDIALKCNHVSVSLIASSKMKIVLIFISYVYECIIRQAFSFDMESFLSRLFLLSFRCCSIKFIFRQSLSFTIFLMFPMQCALIWICVQVCCYARFNIILLISL